MTNSNSTPIELADHDNSSILNPTSESHRNLRPEFPIELIFEVLDNIFASTPSIHTKRCCELGEHLHSDPPHALILDHSLGYFIHRFGWQDINNCSLVSRAVRGYTLPQLFHKVKVNSSKEFTGLYKQLRSLVVVPTTCDSGVTLVKSLSIRFDHGTGRKVARGSMPPVHPSFEIVASLSELYLELFDSSVAPHRKLAYRRSAEFDMEEMDRGDILQWGVSVPKYLQALTEMAMPFARSRLVACGFRGTH
ncbi:hypothetical protein FA15DRAFT_220179 [Coprinopsis marcescibilis]|uniref:Uncharacterized protein n=1 Tax=Coprinopsis marcescibilis TaxID=230819 RepID=A0A5C3L3H6_COPMA|nr:hypothetical protein FA15DRAFT_220179 [Coprinopsis marcescibilis]